MDACLSYRERHFAPGGEHPADALWLAPLDACAECRLAVENLPQAERPLSQVARTPVDLPDFVTIATAAASAARAQRQRRLVRRSAPFFYTGLAAAAVAATLMA